MNYDDLVRKLRDSAGIEAQGMRVAGYGPAGGMSEFKNEWTLFWKAADAIQELQRDAMRYRWLFGHELGDIGYRYQQVWRAWDGDGGCAGFSKFVDAAIDEAMQRE